MSEPSPGRRYFVTLLTIPPWALLLIQFLLVLPRYRKLYAEFGLKLPRLTQFFFDLSAWLQRHILLAALATFFLIAASVVVSYFAQSMGVSKSRRRCVLLIIFSVPCLLFVASWWAVISIQHDLVDGFNK